LIQRDRSIERSSRVHIELQYRPGMPRTSIEPSVLLAQSTAKLQ
jgi:hypothetical protein